MKKFSTPMVALIALVIAGLAIVGADTAEAAKSAVGGAMNAATSVGGDAVTTVRDALVNAAALPRDVVESAIKGSEEKSE